MRTRAIARIEQNLATIRHIEGVGKKIMAKLQTDMDQYIWLVLFTATFLRYYVEEKVSQIKFHSFSCQIVSNFHTTRMVNINQ